MTTLNMNEAIMSLDLLSVAMGDETAEANVKDYIEAYEASESLQERDEALEGFVKGALAIFESLPLPIGDYQTAMRTHTLSDIYRAAR